MRRIVTYSIFAFILWIALTVLPGSAFGQPSLAPGLSALVDRDGDSDSLVRVVIFFESDKRQVSRLAAAELSRDERLRQVTAGLKAQKAPGRSEVVSFLNQHTHSEISEYWITPAVAATVEIRDLDRIAAITGVRLVVEDAPVTVIEPVEERAAGGSLAASVNPPLTQLKVPALWQRGLTGKGRLVCSFDTGVKYDHAALLSKWRGNTAALSAAWFSKVAPLTPPADASGHGTHTMGIMVGSDGADTIGVAPGAQWITAGVIDQGRPLATTLSDILEAFQWALNPDSNDATTNDVPDVILNSWGVPKGLFTPCDVTFAAAIENVEAAGIVTVFAAGNEGPGAMTMRNPADMVLSPTSAFAVGAVDNYNYVASFSSRGPASCDGTTVKPDIMAPGVGIRSSYRDGSYKVLSGSSMAAPFIAGLVALIREYNPNATVAQIKNAIIQSATDLGAAGKDNDYGYGLVDASRLLDYIPGEDEPTFSITQLTVSGDGLATPGERFDLSVTLANASGNVDRAVGTIVHTSGTGVSTPVAQATFFFGGDRLSAVSFTPFTLQFSDTLYNGQRLSFDLRVAYNLGADSAVISFTLPVGVKPLGTFATHATAQIDMTVSDFGMFGLAEGSIYNVRGDGFRFDGSANLLYEAGIILGRDTLQVSSGVRGADGGFAPTDFAPIDSLSEEWIGLDGGYRRSARYDDRKSDIPLPIAIRQVTASYPGQTDNGLVLVTFRLQNTGPEAVTGLHFGMLVDFDLDGPETIAYDADLNLMYQSSGSGPLAAVVGLDRAVSFQAFDNADTAKTGFTNAGLFDIISRPGVDLGAAGGGDRFFVVGAGPFSIPAGDSVEVSFAFVGGRSQDELYANAASARQLHDQATGAGNDALPVVWELQQNYPNPFNPSTNIAFALPKAAAVSLRVYNTLGQEVAVLCDEPLAAGRHAIEWNAGGFASGVYFYRLTVDNANLTRKMVLVK